MEFIEIGQFRQAIQERNALAKRIELFEKLLNDIADVIGYTEGYSGVDTDDQRFLDAIRNAVK